jgi:4-hydroxy-tetrahydrodipicolinate synthase
MDARLRPDPDLMAQHCHYLLEEGADGLIILGTTGEANSLAVPERVDVVEGLLNRGIDPGVLMVGTGCCAYPDTITLTQHALTNGIRNVLVLPPFYYKQVGVQGLEAYFSKVMDGVGDDRLQLYLYHFPQLSGVPFTHDLIRVLLKRFGRVIAGMKDSGGDCDHMKSIMDTFPGLRLYAGSEEYLFPNLRDGGAGCISATANVVVGHAARVVQAFRRQEDATALQTRLSALREIFSGKPFVAVLKAFLAAQSGDDRWLHMRPPHVQPDPETTRKLIGRYHSTLSLPME